MALTSNFFHSLSSLIGVEDKLRGNDTAADDQLEAPSRGETKPGPLGPDLYYVNQFLNSEVW